MTHDVTLALGTTVKVMTEEETVAHLHATKCSLARFGDAEIAMMYARGSKYQTLHAGAMRELITVASGKFYPKLLTAIPHAHEGYRSNWWQKSYLPLLNRYINPQHVFGSAFITRPDHATWIRTQEYWDSLRALWAGERVILVGSGYSLTHKHLSNAEFLGQYTLPLKDAYELIDDVEKFIRRGKPTLVILCAGIMATCLAARLSARGIRALDLGAAGQSKHWQPLRI